jgi:heterotetrameric sarcosine oxidase gamma subunit
VANQALAAQSAFTDWKPVKTPHLSIEVRDDLTIASFAAGKGKADDLKAAIRAAYGVELPTTPERIVAKDVAFIWYGPDQWLAVAERGAGSGPGSVSGRDLEIELKKVATGLAAVVDQSDGRAVIRISGARARDVLAKGLPIDLHPRAFKANGVAITHASHIGVILWQLGAEPTYEIAMFRSFADSFTHWLKDSAAEFTRT